MRTYYRHLITVILVIIPAFSFSQDRMRPLRGSVNMPGFNNVLPSVSGDGNTLVYMNDYSDDGKFYIQLSRRDAGGKWSSAQAMTITNPSGSLMHGSYCLSFDGSILIFGSRKGNGVGGYDLWWTLHDESGWSVPRNIGAPVNSTVHDVFPSLSPDGNTLYFTRCQTADASTASECKILTAERKRGRIKGWEQPEELTSINAGDVKMPRIAPDNKTLYYVSGDVDNATWKMTRNEGGTWSRSAPLEFFNGQEGKQNMAIYYRPDVFITTRKNDRGKTMFVESKVPENFMPHKAVIKYGKVVDGSGLPIRSDIRVVDYDTGENISAVQPDIETGAFTIIISDGLRYDFSVNSRGGPEVYYSELLELTSLRSSRREQNDYSLKSLDKGTIIPMHLLQFENNSLEIDVRSEPEIKRLVRLLERNQDFDLTVHAFQDTVIYDSIPRPELTEIIADTLVTYEVVLREDSIYASFPELETSQVDSIITVWNDSLEAVKYDTLLAELFLASLIGNVDSIEHKEVHYTYHNDLTQKKADAFADSLIKLNIDPERITSQGHSDQDQPQSIFDPEEMKKGVIEISFDR